MKTSWILLSTSLLDNEPVSQSLKPSPLYTLVHTHTRQIHKLSCDCLAVSVMFVCLSTLCSLLTFVAENGELFQILWDFFFYSRTPKKKKSAVIGASFLPAGPALLHQRAAFHFKPRPQEDVA